MLKWIMNNKAVVTNIVGVLIAIVAYFINNDVFPQFLTIEGAILAILNIIFNALKSNEIAALATENAKLQAQVMTSQIKK